jgi:hypothetical protein
LERKAAAPGLALPAIIHYIAKKSKTQADIPFFYRFSNFF